MYYACTFDKWSGQLLTADQCDSLEEAQQFIADTLSNLWPTEKVVILTATEYRKEKERF